MYNFGQAVNQNLSSVAESAAAVMDIAQTLTTSVGVFLINGVEGLSSAAVQIGDSVQVRLTTSNTYSTPTIAVVTSSANSIVSYFLVCTKDAANKQTPASVYFTSPSIIPRNTALNTSEVIVAGIDLTASITAKVAPVYGAYIVKNGANVGNTTSVGLNDTLSVAFTSPATENLSVNIPLSIGNTVVMFTSKTAFKVSKPTDFSFTPALDSIPGSLVTSNAVTISGLEADAPLIVTVSSGFVGKNGSYASQQTVYNGDVLTVQAQAPLNAEDAAFISVQVGSYSLIWTICNKGSPYFVKPSYLGVSPLDYPVTASNSDVSCLSITNDTATYIPLTSPTNTVITGNNVAVLLNYLGSLIYVIDTVTNLLVKTITLPAGSKPIAADYYSKNPGTTSLIVGLKGSNTVNIYDSTYTLVSSFSVPQLDGLCVGKDDRIYVSDTVGGSVYKYNTAGTLVQTLTIAAPTVIKAVEDFVYVSSKNGSIYKIVNEDVSVFAVDIYATDFDINATQYAYISSYDNSLTVNLDDNHTKIYLSFIPVSVCIAGDSVYVSDTSRTLYKVDTLTGTITPFDTNAMVYGIGFVEGSLYAVECYKNVDLNTLAIANTQPVLTYTPGNVTDAALSYPYLSPLITVSGVVRTAQINIQPYSGVIVKKNGAEVVGTKLIVSTGDTVEFYCDSRLGYVEQRVSYATCRAASVSFSITTAPKLIPDYMTFNPLYGQWIGDVVETQSMTIAGLTPGQTTILSITSSSPYYGFLLNGEPAGVEVEVTNGDELAIFITVEGMYGTSNNYYVTCSDFFGTISVVAEELIASQGLDGATPWVVFDRLQIDTGWNKTEYDIETINSRNSIYTTPNNIVVSSSQEAEVLEHKRITTDYRAVGSYRNSDGTLTDYLASGRSKGSSGILTDIPYTDSTDVVNKLQALVELPYSSLIGIRAGSLYDSPYSSVKESIALAPSSLYSWNKMEALSPAFVVLSTGAVAQHFSAKTTLGEFALLYKNPVSLFSANVSKAIGASVWSAQQAFSLGFGAYSHPVDTQYRLGINFPAVTVDTYFTETVYSLYDCVLSEFIKAESSIELIDHFPAIKPWFTSYFIDIVSLFVQFTDYAVEALPPALVQPISYPVDLNKAGVFHYTMSEVAAYYEDVAISMYEVPLNQYIEISDTVVEDPTPLSCPVLGLFTTDEQIQADALQQGYTDNVTVVIYKGCKLWTVPPNREFISCGASSGGLIEPLSWAVYQSITPLNSGVSKLSGYVGGG